MKKLPEFMENTMIYDMKEAMEKHMNNCIECRCAYEAEKSLDEMFVNALQFEDIKFNSSRAEIMRSIDKNRYGKGPIKKVKYGLKKFRWQIVSTAAVLVIGITSAPLIMGLNSQENDPNQFIASGQIESVQDNSNMASMKQAVLPKEEVENNRMGIASFNEPQSFAATEDTKQVYMPVFEKTVIDKVAEPDFGSPWKKSPDGALEVSMNGKGINAAEEGIADLIISRKTDSALWKFSLMNNDMKQFSPMFVEWFDNENVLVTMGLGYGTVTFGGDLILLNVNTGKTFNIYPEYSMDNKNQVVNVVRKENTLELTLRLYEDDNLISYKEEKRIFTFKEDESIGLILTEINRIPQS
jgi:hypothetical protein